ncbi:Sec18p, putative [Perkinsus marinus ATCC 50983]|uniref:Sec18p, putative n=1 Tax=Perkinsus marinus (strain ATCC 50983 / TXsc) TaxID=423536 RepID=C5KGT2_PERM5|nr:Sec18p, putative [Perkinsus marinus ATCC 50983]EER16350.1 Sec18p, putative [Perkinsus marinus ATCC 50983]|eukprot:XP_002784554.1 Sec18p, putative [Perkinsus marinus ATCC 50983]
MADRTTIPCVNCDACGDIMHILPCCHKLCQSCAAGEDLKCPRCDVVVWERMTLPEVQGSSPTEGDRPYAYHALQQEPNTLFHGVKQKTVGNKKISEYGGLHIKTDDDIIRCGIGPLTGQIGDTTGGSGLGQFRSPYSVCNHSGRMFVSDSLNHRVQVFDTNTLQLVYTIGQRGDGEGEFCDPSGIGVDAEGRIIVAEYGNDRVQIFDKDGKFLQCCGTFGSDEGEFYGPFGVHVCPATQNLLITDSCNHRVQVLWSSDGHHHEGRPNEPSSSLTFAAPTGVVSTPSPHSQLLFNAFSVSINRAPFM